ncbi:MULTISPECIES: PepSY domain-containing protein [unclassified Nocardia]|uniref:PepSY-associated TM helix domain-containing protein n=1 Tax=unclassified Nocardia TaxID=2637762 RepID=UPI001CE3B74C|nr:MULTISPECIES: PepSY-associated TM helix domain-containing protein [unclassified Nocardia]
MVVETRNRIARRKQPVLARHRALRELVRRTRIAHRWTTPVLGLFLLIQVICGTILLFRPQLDQLRHPELFAKTESAQAITATQAIAAAQAVKPDLTGPIATLVDGVFQVRSGKAGEAVYVDPGSGAILGTADPDGGVLGFVTNLHSCALSCERYPGYQPWLTAKVPFIELKISQLILGGIGLTLVWWSLSGLLIWWPGIRNIKQRLTIHLRRGDYRRNRDLHAVIGVASCAFLLFWGITGAGFELPAIGKVWYALTGGAPAKSEYNSARATGPDIGGDRAIAAAAALVPDGRLVYLAEPSPKPADTYRVAFALNTDMGRYGGTVPLPSVIVAVDRHTGDTHFIKGGTDMSPSTTLWQKWSYGLHFGYLAPWPVRLLWLAFGLAPIALAITGFRTWYQRRRRAAPPT